jgi:hypothetical protein
MPSWFAKLLELLSLANQLGSHIIFLPWYSTYYLSLSLIREDEGRRPPRQRNATNYTAPRRSRVRILPF